MLAAGEAAAQSFSTVLSTNLFQPTGISVSPLNRYLISDTANNRVIEFNPDTSALSVLAGGSGGAVDGQGIDAAFRSPQGILALNDGIIVADTGNNVIRRISYQGLVETIAGNLALAHEADEIGGVPSNGGFTDGPALSASFRNPSGLAFDGQNRVFIADSGNRAIRVLDLSTRTVSTLVSSGLSLPTGLAVGLGGELFIADTGTHSIKRWRQGDAVPALVAGKNSAFDSGFRNSAVATNALFRSPRGIYYREAKDELVIADTVNGVLRTILNVSTSSPRVETFALTDTAGFRSPVAVTRDSAGIFLVLDSEKSSLHSVITVQTPRIAEPKIGFIRIVILPDTGAEVAILEPVTDSTFENDVIIAISGESGAVHHYTLGPGPTNVLQSDSIPVPNENSPTAPNFVSPGPASPLPRTLDSPQPVLRIKAYSTGREGEERIPSRVVTSTFRFQVATPELNSKETPGAIVFKDATQGAAIFYTLDGSEPVNSTNVNPNVRGPARHGDSIPLIVGTNKLTIKARAYRADYRESSLAIAEFSPTNFVPNRISLGFEYGEASSEFIASAGQRFYAPVTLSLLPGAKAYGLQFNLSVEAETGPSVADFGMSFESMLMKPLPSGEFVTIPPSTFVGLFPQVETYYFTNSVEGRIITNSFNFTNFYQIFSNLLFTNISQRILGVGWNERIPKTNLYNTVVQDLITYSIPHDRLFLSANGQAVPGGFSFFVPPNAQAGDTYKVRVDRPSATADGVSADIYIQAPDEDDISPVRAVRTLTIGSKRYLVGDVSPFRWFNAGDFGDTNILNNDITQIMEVLAYGYGYPPVGSDFWDAMDTCCVTTNGVNLSDLFEYWDGNDQIINTIGFGDNSLAKTPLKAIDFSDLFVAFRRSLDPSLVWYERYWSNGVRHASVVTNQFRGERALTRQSTAQTPPQSDPVLQTTERPALRMGLANVTGVPGQNVSVPITAEVAGGYPLRGLMLGIEIEPLDGATLPAQIDFVPGALGAPTTLVNRRPGHLGAIWLNTDVNGLIGQGTLGAIVFRVPSDASPSAIYRVKFGHASGSPNGISLFPVSKTDGVVSMANRPADTAWNDGIPDSWRVQYFGAIATPISHSMLDPDGDGVNNLREFKTGTNPLDAADNLRVQASTNAREMRLKFRTVVGRNYVLEASETLEPGSWRVVRPDIAGTGSSIEATESSAGAQLYYRLRLKE